MSIRYNEKKYQYLRFMKSMRQGKKVKQMELMNLANLSDTPAEKTKKILEELKGLLSFCNSLSGFTAGCAGTSFLMALETAFQPLKACPPALLKSIYSGEKEEKKVNRDEEMFFKLIRECHPKREGDFILWIDRVNIGESRENLWIGYLMSDSGLPYQHFLFNIEDFSSTSFTRFLSTLKEQYQAQNLVVLLPAFFPPLINYNEGKTENMDIINNQRYYWLGLCLILGKYYSIVSDATELYGNKLQQLIDKAADSINDFHIFVEKMENIEIGVKEDEFIDMFIMSHLFSMLMDIKIRAIHLN